MPEFTRGDEVEQCVTELYFVLSAYNCQDLSRFSAPSVRLFDPQTPEAQLCESPPQLDVIV